MSTTMEQVFSQLQQELFALRAQVTARSGLAEAVQAINNLATAQVRKDTPSLIDVVEEDGGILRWCDHGVGDDVGVGR